MAFRVTFAKTVHIIFPSTVKYVDLGFDTYYRWESGRCGKRYPGESCHRVAFRRNELFRYLRGRQFFTVLMRNMQQNPEMLNIEMKDFLENDVTDYSHTG